MLTNSNLKILTLTNDPNEHYIYYTNIYVLLSTLFFIFLFFIKDLLSTLNFDQKDL